MPPNRPDSESRPQRRPVPQRTRRLQLPSAAARGQARRRPRERERHEATEEQRMLAVVGVAALLIIGLIVMIKLFTIDGEDDFDSFARSADPVAPGERSPRREPATATRDTTRDGPRRSSAPLTAEEREARRAAIATVSNQGFRAIEPSQWQPRHQLRVLIGEAQRASGKEGSKAFFFVGGDYIGSDAAAPSAKVLVGRQSNTQITLRYVPYAIDDPPCCPAGDSVNVRFEWDGQQLTPLDPIPAADVRLQTTG